MRNLHQLLQFSTILVSLANASFSTCSVAADLPRVASINLCTDQLLLALADPEQIVGLSPYSRDPIQSWDAEKAKQFRQLSGNAEDVLVLSPDIVVAGDYTKRATRELLKEKKLNVVEFNAVHSINEAKAQLARMGDLIKQRERAASEIARLDAAVLRAQKISSRKPYRILVLARRGWVTGKDSLATSILEILGLQNAAREFGFDMGGFASIETILTVKPDFLLVADGNDYAADEGQAFLLHPALERFYPASKRIVIPEKLTVCGGPMLVDALNRFASELERIDP